MKTNLLSSILVTFIFLLPNIVIAGNADDILARCKLRAEQKFKECTVSDEKCEKWFDQAYEKCYEQYKVNSETGSNAYDANGRFTPVPIPQRPAAILPGQR